MKMCGLKFFIGSKSKAELWSSLRNIGSFSALQVHISIGAKG